MTIVRLCAMSIREMRDGTRRLRVEHIADRMACFAWDRAAFEECVEEWDISRSYMAELVRQAANTISYKINEPGFVSALVAQSLFRVLEKAEAQGDWKSVVAAGATWARLAGPRQNDPGLAQSEVPDNDPELTSCDT